MLKVHVYYVKLSFMDNNQTRLYTYSESYLTGFLNRMASLYQDYWQWSKVQQEI